ncbi:hypothetical protein [Xanthomonas sp. 3075]|nr:hypothetical protein [Xanthomonas sp. 3075]MBB4133199.1 hypothetical protein [Xanthomonas sp. 3075]
MTLRCAAAGVPCGYPGPATTWQTGHLLAQQSQRAQDRFDSASTSGATL